MILNEGGLRNPLLLVEGGGSRADDAPGRVSFRKKYLLRRQQNYFALDQTQAEAVSGLVPVQA